MLRRARLLKHVTSLQDRQRGAVLHNCQPEEALATLTGMASGMCKDEAPEERQKLPASETEDHCSYAASGVA